MSDLVPSNGNNFTMKSFWERPEGTSGMITIGLLGLGGFFLAKAILPTLLSVFGMAITALGQLYAIGALCLGLAAIIWVLMNPKFQTLVKYGFMTAMRRATNLFVPTFAIDILKNYRETRIEKNEIFATKVAELNGQKKGCTDYINENNEEIKRALELVRAAKEKNNVTVMRVNAAQADRLSKTNKELTAFEAQLSSLLVQFRRLQQANEACIADLGNDIKDRERKSKFMNSAYSAISASKSILKGDADEKELYDMADEFLLEDYNRKFGEIDDFMTQVAPILDGIDLSNDAATARALQQLQELESRSVGELGSDQRLLLEQKNITNPIPLTIGQPQLVSSSYDNLFSGKR